MSRWKIKWSDTEKRTTVDGVDVTDTIAGYHMRFTSDRHEVYLLLAADETDWTCVDSPEPPPPTKPSPDVHVHIKGDTAGVEQAVREAFNRALRRTGQ